ncbi:carboxymuconolactone decarboxylase family protein [Elongatibacter sediminis]|uniref:Peroxidase-related enzyme n=1 Tax=Elongatibacter sediminis TaxID=3119006 RepID=A0AAW9RJS5_9GAMM
MAFVSFLRAGHGLGGLFTREPDRYRHCMDLGKTLMTGPGELKRRERELLAAYVSALNACSFCAGTHTGIARAFGWDANVLEDLLEDPAAAAVPETLTPILLFVRKLTLQPMRCTAADVEAITKAGWTEQTVSDVVAIAAYYAMTNRLASGHGIEALSGEENAAIGRHIAEQGYPDIESLAVPRSDEDGEIG